MLRLQSIRGNRYVQRLVAQARSTVPQHLAPDPVGAAQDGVAGPGRPLPHLERVQAAFGRHDVRDARVHEGPRATSAADRLAALAYTTGSHIAIRGPVDLALAAHEAAHVVQQRHGARPAGGIGAPGDAYERQADAVAAAVVSGRSAEPLLDRAVGGVTPDGPRTVQLTPVSIRLGFGRVSARVDKEIADLSVGELKTRADHRCLEASADQTRDTAASGPTGNPLTALSAAHASVKMANTEDRLGVEGFLTDAERVIAPIGLAGDLAAAWRAIDEIRDNVGPAFSRNSSLALQRVAKERIRQQARLLAQAINNFLAAMDANDVTAGLHRFEQKYGSSGDRDKSTAVKLLSQVLELGHEHSGERPIATPSSSSAPWPGW